MRGLCPESRFMTFLRGWAEAALIHLSPASGGGVLYNNGRQVHELRPDTG